jgi:undecaprenyl-diphosphatase
MNLIEAIILAIIQGITEFLPISSTGHMIIASSLMNISHDNFTKLFEVVIQLGSILSVLVLYWKRFLQSVNFYYKLFIAFIPAAIFGVLFSKQIDAFLDKPLIVGISLLMGGVIFLFTDKWFKEEKAIIKDTPSYLTSLKIGFFQCIAMIPGVSRSAATIIGGLSQKLTRKAAAEFSFFLAVPTMFAATAKKLFDYYHEINEIKLLAIKNIIGNSLDEAQIKLLGIENVVRNSLDVDQIKLLAIGNIISFLVAMLAIKTFITFLTKHGFKSFGYYRILAGAVILIMIFMQYHLKM